ncbi:MAG TPA: sigma-70 family RNA polymerase sigma factor [Dehalococcoidia bacterium]|nr:sigma-70 family RNA polymerase sigma factor [Dehalococcoidia bacterium]
MAATVSVALPATAATGARETTAAPLDEATWSKIFDDNYALIYRYAHARLGCREDAEELASQVFLEALRSIHLYKPTDKPILAWLYGIARNLVANHVRRKQRAKAAYDTFAQKLSLPAGDFIVDRLALSQALGKLTPEQRDVIVMRFISGLSTPEIAAAMGRKEGAIYSLQVRALASLRKVLSS